MSKQRCLNKFLFKSVSSKIFDALAKSVFPSTVYKIEDIIGKIKLSGKTDMKIFLLN